MIRLPPRSPLFPYTPLFRSSRGHRRRELPPDPLERLFAEAGQPRRPARRLGAHLGLRGLGQAIPEPPPRRQDRKSTRLNSSHANISYAVFCLKKKKNHISKV